MQHKKIYLSLLVLIIAVFVCLFYYNKYNVAPAINIAKLEVVDKDTVLFDIASLKGKKVIVSFYASWCPGCLQELKSLNAIYNQKLSDVVVLAITDESIDKMEAFRVKKQYPFQFYTLTGNFQDIGIFSIPAVYILNAKGEQVYEHVGFVDWQDESTFNHLKSLLDS